MFIGAHPDDADIQFGGTAILLRQLGHNIIFVSMTDGSAGHHELSRTALADRRLNETKRAAKFLDITYIVMDLLDGELVADLATRHKLMRLIREQKPDVIISPRPYDYHTDHRATSVLARDCSFLLTVPNVCPETHALDKSPAIFFHQDGFKKPVPFAPDVIVDITPVIDRKMQNLAHHESQVFEWLPFVKPIVEPVPATQADRIEWLKRYWGDPGGVSRFIPKPEVKHIEAFEVCEYGAVVDDEVLSALFPRSMIVR